MAVAANDSLALPAALLSPTDVGVFVALLLLLSAGLALLFALLGHKTPTHFFLGGRQMRPVPVGLSAGVCALPAAAFLKFPNEAFASGCSVALAPFSGALSFLLVSAFAIEVLRPLRMDSLGAYFLARFRSRRFVHFTDCLALACALPTVGFYLCDPLRLLLAWTDGRVGAALSIALVSLLVVASASAGGFRGIVWGEALMAVVLLAGGLAVIFKSALDTPGGMATILRLNMDLGRLHLPPLTFDPGDRHNLFALTVAVFVGWGLVAAQPSNVQRLCSTATRREAYLVATTATATTFAFSLLSIWAGVNIFGYFAHRGCAALGAATKQDVVVIFAEQALGRPGCRGLVLAAVFVGAVSYFSAAVNSVAFVLWKNLLSPRYFRHAAHRSALLVSRILSFGCGLLAMTASYLLFFLTPSIQHLAPTYIAALWAPYLGILLIVATFRKAHPVGVAVGAVIASAVTFWLGVVSSNCPRTSPAPDPVCSGNNTYLQPSSLQNATAEASSTIPSWLSCISPLWLPPVGLTLTMALSFLASVLCCCCCRGGGRRRRRSSGRVGDDAMPKRVRDTDCLYVSLSTIEH